MSPNSSQDTSKNETYTPPRLPAVLSDTHHLKPIVGVPTDEEVKAVHAAIRAVNGILNVPSLYDPNLPMQLAQHLFNVQMAVYRSTYSFGVFPGDATYTPPLLPSHIPITLEPVIGAPSDEELKLAQNTARAMENLANTPSIFDPDLSMNLSQHLFNIQIGMLDSDITLNLDRSLCSTAKRRQHVLIDPASEATSLAGPKGDVQDEAASVDVEEQRADAATQPVPLPALDHSGPTQPTSVTQLPDETRARVVPGETTLMLGEIGDELRNLRNALLSTQRSLIWSRSKWDPNSLVDEKGDLPSKYGLPRLAYHYKYGTNGDYRRDPHSNPIRYMRKSSSCDLSDHQLASYLRFYSIGLDLIEDHGEATIAPGKKEEAEILLYEHLYAAT